MENLPKKIMHKAASGYKEPGFEREKKFAAGPAHTPTDTIVVASSILLAAVALMIGFMYM